jgi:ATP-binding cassette subfamily F protein 2
MPSASKQKRLAEKAAKASAKKAAGGSTETGTSTPTESPYGSGVSTPLTSRSAAGSQEDLMSMAKIRKAVERSVDLLYFPIAFVD